MTHGQRNPKVIAPYRRPSDGGELAGWQVEPNTAHKRVRARTVALLHKLTITGC